MSRFDADEEFIERVFRAFGLDADALESNWKPNPSSLNSVARR